MGRVEKTLNSAHGRPRDRVALGQSHNLRIIGKERDRDPQISYKGVPLGPRGLISDNRPRQNKFPSASSINGQTTSLKPPGRTRRCRRR